MNTYLVDTNGSDYDEFISAAELLHAGGLLSKTQNVAGTQELVKVNNSKILEHDCIIKRYDNTNREEIFSFFYTDKWQAVE